MFIHNKYREKYPHETTFSYISRLLVTSIVSGIITGLIAGIVLKFLNIYCRNLEAYQFY